MLLTTSTLSLLLPLLCWKQIRRKKATVQLNYAYDRLRDNWQFHFPAH